VVVGALPEAVVAAQPVDVPREGREVGAHEHLGSRTDDGLHHAVEVRIEALQLTLLQVVSQKPQIPTGISECFPRRIYRTSFGLLSNWIFLTRFA